MYACTVSNSYHCCDDESNLPYLSDFSDVSRAKLCHKRPTHARTIKSRKVSNPVTGIQIDLELTVFYNQRSNNP